jgi:hypothetical protein
MHAPTYSTTKVLWVNPSYTEEDRTVIRDRFKLPFDGDSPSPWQGYVRPSRAKQDSIKPSPQPYPTFEFDKD